MESLIPYRESFEKYLRSHPFDRQPSNLYEPANYIMALGGKRLRAVLAMLGHQLFDPAYQEALPVAMAVEIFHNFSLVHDDIMDQAPLRRNKPTVHRKYGVDAGILSGDVMLVYAYEWLNRLPENAPLRSLLTTFNRVAMEVCEGQQWDMNFEQQEDLCLEDYLAMIELKTAALLSGSLELGAILAGAEAGQLEQVYGFGRNMGIAFQLQDDLLDTFGKPGRVGKKRGGDILRNKKTFLILEAFKRAEGGTYQELTKWMTGSHQDEQQKVERVTTILEQLDMPAFGAGLKNKYVRLALDHLDRMAADRHVKELLADLLVFVVGREN